MTTQQLDLRNGDECQPVSPCCFGGSLRYLVSCT